MKFSEKLIALRKNNGMTQEELAERLNVSRQAISRWEQGNSMPDAANILQLSKLYHLTADYLLNEEFESDLDVPKVKAVNQEHGKQIMFYLLILEVMILMMQFMTFVILQNLFFGILSCIPFVAAIGGFEWSYRKNGNAASKEFRKRFYKISAWLGLYFPVRFIMSVVVSFYPRPYLMIVFEIITVVVYLAVTVCTTLTIEKKL